MLKLTEVIERFTRRCHQLTCALIIVYAFFLSVIIVWMINQRRLIKLGYMCLAENIRVMRFGCSYVTSSETIEFQNITASPLLFKLSV